LDRSLSAVANALAGVKVPSAYIEGEIAVVG
jgi:hypothetical protein